ncbi:MAG: CBS domain-containing protein [Nitrososphaerota archaeon]|jgi:CBS domain-containing protein|uniref:CBS domain-containing protein n=1 Tax=Candidatus Bathycorpusculum sp. TaxID=2994959 RepID=UPI0028358A8B|nr:CBS domain-containing protein [Candidatus Termitimicrobium sp.]MCL2431023.1 CBS domain-containing protein [Candidatus Termitimicrobium sp.]MDR0493728.1 CBS domain-containing protein [Nitrososphaerota archaeon]
MLKVKDIMCRKVITVKEDISIQEAVQLLNDRHIGSIVIIDDEERCRGIFTERDAIRIFAAKHSPEEPLSKIMSSNVVTISLEASFDEAKRLMLSHGIRHLPVIDQTDKLIGLFSLRSFLDEVLGIKTPASSTDS